MTDTRDRDMVLSELHRLYRTDFVAWTRDQAEALRRAADAPQPVITNRPLDWEDLAEEIESLGTSQRTALSSQIRRILHHLLKLEFSPAEAPRNAWRRSIREARIAAQHVLDGSPSLGPEIASMVADETRHAVKLALGDLEDHGECDATRRAALACRRYDIGTEVFSDWMPERPKQ